MDDTVRMTLMIAGQILGIVAFFGMIAVFVWLDQRGKTQRRQLEHAERMRALDRGVPLQDAETARWNALGAIGVAVPVSAFSAAALATGLLMIKPEIAFVALVVLWPVAGVVSLVSTLVVLAYFRDRPRPTPPQPFDERPAARPTTAITEQRP